MKKNWDRIIMAILTIALIGATIFNALNLDDLNRKNILLEQMIVTLKTNNEKSLESAKAELQGDIGRTQGDLADLENNVQNKVDGAEFEKSLGAVKEGMARKADIVEFENKIFDPVKIYNETKKSSVSIATNIGSSAGFLFKEKNQIVTAYHAVKAGPGAIVMVIPNDQVHFFIMGKVKKVKPEWDLALIELDEPSDAEPLLPRDGPPSVGEPIVVIGNPGNLNNSVSTGVISGLERNFNQFPEMNFIQIDASAYFGNSGGPVIDRNGKVIGLMSQTIDASNPTSFSMVVPIDYVRRFLEGK